MDDLPGPPSLSPTSRFSDSIEIEDRNIPKVLFLLDLFDDDIVSIFI